MLDKLIDNTNKNYDINDITIMRITSDEYTILKNKEKIDSYNIITSKNEKLYLNVNKNSILINNEIEILCKNDELFYSLIDDIISYIEIIEKTNPPKQCEYDTMVKEANDFIEIISNISSKS